jgi:hypothetical protein
MLLLVSVESIYFLKDCSSALSQVKKNLDIKFIESDRFFLDIF